ncbi:substrate-binding domain-containing protein [Kitasatospora sp. NPDC058965]|uniref:substrate-binding domain-containing protein n=1 Tax=Kitasatospora sp. NPDC058965 TaxID=3346682 RepID=UPI003696D4E6
MSSATEDRRTRILRAVENLGSVRLVDLGQHLGVPVVTLRRDVAALAEAGLVHRAHGSVSAVAAGGGAPGGPTIGLVVPTVHQYFGEVIAGARTAATDAGATLVLSISSYEAGADRAQADRLLESGAEGLLMTPTWMPGGNSDGRAWIAELPVPVVLVERRAAAGTPASRLDSVYSDHHVGVLLALQHLVARGHAAVALAARTDTWTAQRVRSGYAEGCALLGLPARPVIDLPGTPAGSGAVVEQVAAAVDGGTRALLVHNDQDAIQLLPLLRARGLTVPEDLAVISYDDVFAALGAPPLTAVAPPKQAVGRAAVEVLLRRLRSGSALPVHHLGLLPELKVRSTCGAHPGRT